MDNEIKELSGVLDLHVLSVGKDINQELNK